MKKGIIFILLIVFLVFTSFDTVFAAPSFGRFFGGKIISPIAIKVLALEFAGFVCPIAGTSISIIPIGSPILTPTDYYIPPYVTSKTGTVPTAGQLILGRYAGQMTIVCIFPSVPPLTQTISLDIINLFGTSVGIGS